MRRIVVALFSSVVLLSAMSGVRSVGAAPPTVDYRPVDIGPRIRSWAATPDRIAPSDGSAVAAEQSAAVAAVSASSTDCVTATKYWLVLNDTTGRYQLAAFQLMADGAAAQVWVQSNLAWPSGDPRTAPVVTCEQASSMLGQFESNIQPTEVASFDGAVAHDGSAAQLPLLLAATFPLPLDYYYDAAGRQAILVSNIRDANYLDPDYPTYVPGFYAPSFEVYFDRNVISLDAYDWASQTGPSGSNPYLYEGVLAHEYQHLLQDDYDADEETFVVEGMADLAVHLTGYGVSLKSHLDAAAAKPENSLVVWGDQGDAEILADHGQAYLFQHYLLEQFGPAFVKALFHEAANGVGGISATLAASGTDRTFADVVHDWSVAMLVDTKTPRYTFRTLDFTLEVGSASTPNPEAFATPGAPPWGTDYVWIDGDPKQVGKFTFNGVDYSHVPTPWTSDGAALWAGTGSLVDRWAVFPAKGGGSLTFDTRYDIEEGWDFGFVQVSTDGGSTWTSLANGSTTSAHDPGAHPDVVANLPGFTGSTGGAWVPMSFDLTAYAGVDVLLAFRYVTDWATNGAGWFVDNVAVDGTLVSDGSSIAPFTDLTGIVATDTNFRVTFVGFVEKKKGTDVKVLRMNLNHRTEEGRLELDKLLKGSGSAVMLVTYEAPQGIEAYAAYTYGFTSGGKGPKK